MTKNTTFGVQGFPVKTTGSSTRDQGGKMQINLINATGDSHCFSGIQSHLLLNNFLSLESLNPWTHCDEDPNVQRFIPLESETRKLIDKQI